MQYGILIGRFQPLHFGHETIIDEIIKDGLEPIIFIGSSNIKNQKNPLSYIQRASLIHTVYGDRVTTLPLPDRTDNEEWAYSIKNILHGMRISTKNCRVYYFEKPGDFWLAPWLINYFQLHRPISKMPNICSSDIRKNPIEFRGYMNNRVYDRFGEMIDENNKRTRICNSDKREIKVN